MSSFPSLFAKCLPNQFFIIYPCSASLLPVKLFSKNVNFSIFNPQLYMYSNTFANNCHMDQKGVSMNKH